MSNKFKTGDLVEVIDNGGCYTPPARPGLRGTIVCYLGDKVYGTTIVKEAWEINVPVDGRYVFSENSLRKIPGNNDHIPGIEEYDEIGSWDSCFWNPYKSKEKFDS